MSLDHQPIVSYKSQALNISCIKRYNAMTIIYIYINNGLDHDVDSPLQKNLPHLLHILSYRQLLFAISWLSYF